MKIAVTYDNEKIFQHFGRTETFKIYTVEDNKIIDSELINVTGSGHDAVAGILVDNDVTALICGGIGSEAQFALNNAGIKYVAGVDGNADEAVEAFLNGELDDTFSGACADNEGGCCGESDCESGCGGGCGGSCGGCGSRTPAFEGKNVGKTCRTHYRGTFNDGTQFDSSYDRGEPLEFVCGAGMMILGFDKAVANMEVGETINIHLMPEEAYGPSDPRAIAVIPLAELPGAEELVIGDRIALETPMGALPVTVTAKTETDITFDANHEMAGKELNFQIELVEVL